MIHRKQFIASLSEGSLIANSLTIHSKNGPWFIHIGEDAVYQEGKTLNGKQFLLFGVCYHVITGKHVKDCLFESQSYPDIIADKRFWGGRWVLFFDGYVFTDASANLNIFYTETLEGLVSSSLSMLCRVAGYNPDPGREFFFNKQGWYPIPGTRIPGIHSLLPSQYLTPGCHSQIYQKIFDYECGDIDSTYNELICTIRNFLIAVTSDFPVTLPLTGGVDSRTILAFLLSEKTDFKSYTSDYAEIRLHDTLIPWQISRKYRFSYSYLLAEVGMPEYQTRANQYEAHTMGNCLDRDREFYAGNQYPAGKSVMLRGAGWACFRGFYTNDWVNYPNNERNLDQIIKSFPEIGECKDMLDQIKNWLDTVDNLSLEWDWRMQFYIDQRLNAWDGPIEQSIDLTDHYPVQVINSDYQLSLLWRIMCHEQFSGRSDIIQRKIIQHLKPELLQWKFNRFNGLVNPLKKKAVRQMSMLLRKFVGTNQSQSE